MSKEILSQEEIDALLQGLSGEEEETGDLTEEILQAAVREANEDGLELHLRGWEASAAEGSELANISGQMWGTMQYAGDLEATGIYRVPADVLASEDEETTANFTTVMGNIGRAMAARIGDARGYLLDVRVTQPTDALPEIEGLQEAEVYEIYVGLDAPNDVTWEVVLSIPPAIRDLLHGTHSDIPEDEGDEADSFAIEAESDSATAVETSTPDSPAAPAGETYEKEVSPARFSSFGGRGSRKTQAAEDGRLQMLLDVPLQVSVELGRAVADIRKITSLGTGSVIELDRQAGEPVDVLVNGKLIARGEVVVVDESFAVRITEIVSLEDRIRNLR